MNFRRDSQRLQAQCGHRHIKTSVNTGIERRVCEACGHVSFSRSGEAVTIGSIPLPRHEVDSHGDDSHI